MRESEDVSWFQGDEDGKTCMQSGRLLIKMQRKDDDVFMIAAAVEDEMKTQSQKVGE